MTRQSFSLISFATPKIPKIAITGSVARQGAVLTLHYSLTGNVGDISLPSVSAHPSRKDELWRTTCFEFFLAIKDQPQYWEFNLSPCGDWNVYCMDAYRGIGFRKEMSIQQLQVGAEKGTDIFTLDTAIDLQSILPENVPLVVGVTSVIQTRSGDKTYWALTHPALQPDFHRRESFILELAGQTHPSPQSALES